MASFKRILQVLREQDEDLKKKAEAYAQFLEKEVVDFINQEKYNNREALKVANQQFADLVRDNPSIVNEHLCWRKPLLMEMTKSETQTTVADYAKLMDKKIRPLVKKSPLFVDKKDGERWHDTVIDVANNIRNYPEILAYMAMELTDTPYYGGDTF